MGPDFDLGVEVTEDAGGVSSEKGTTTVAGWVHLGFVAMSIMGAYRVVDLATGEMWYGQYLNNTTLDGPVPALPLAIRATWPGFLLVDAVLALMLVGGALAARRLALMRTWLGVALAVVACIHPCDQTAVLAIPYFAALAVILKAGRTGRAIGVLVAVLWLVPMTLHRFAPGRF